jgi:hypothetical protein
MHYLLRVFWRGTWKRRLRELAAIAALSGALLATWFAWSISVYGVRTTLASNTSVTGSREYKGHFLAKTAQNLVYSMVPAAARFDPLTADLRPRRTSRSFGTSCLFSTSRTLFLAWELSAAR